HAAAKLLKNNNSKLNPWPLALTAYNYGQAGMIRAQREKKTYENIFRNHQTGLFKFASRNFYPEFLAARRVAKDIENNTSIILDRPEATITFPLKGYSAARDLRTYFAVSREDFTRLNPALKKPVLSGKKYVPKGYPLRLPATKQIRLKVTNTKPNFYRSRQIRDQVYTVRRGDTAGSISRRYQISLKELIAANNLNRKATIHAGRKLHIPEKRADRGSGSILILTSNAKQKP
ncbi:MAG: LysM peptidoglycan-binding domain-containing protein, partial [Desulfobulbaceae bacterium]|nr:LysM peptidoglycan-binding domain-containing protein [Desulfobulbaceae bacterium]